MKNEKRKVIIESVLTTVFSGLLVYSAYSLWYIFYGTDSSADVHLYTILSGSALYMANEYAARSAIMPLMLMDFFSHQHPEFSFHNEQRALMGDKYYPLDFGSFDKDKMLAMQFSTNDATQGTALVYKREKVTQKEYTVKLNGLVPDATYEIYDVDNPQEIHSLTGTQLMNEGYTLELPEGEKAIILMYNTK